MISYDDVILPFKKIAKKLQGELSCTESQHTVARTLGFSDWQSLTYQIKTAVSDEQTYYAVITNDADRILKEHANAVPIMEQDAKNKVMLVPFNEAQQCLKTTQFFVDGHIEEVPRFRIQIPFTEKHVSFALCNEDGIRLKLPPNWLTPKLVGDVLLCAADPEGDTKGLSKVNAYLVLLLFRYLKITPKMGFVKLGQLDDWTAEYNLEQ